MSELNQQEIAAAVKAGVSYNRFMLRDDENVLKIQKKIDDANQEMFDYLRSRLPEELQAKEQ